MSELSRKFQKSRQARIDAGDFRFFIRRPSDLEATEFSFNGQAEAVRTMARFVVGWEGVKELDVFPGGGGEPLAFDADLFCDWIEDRSDLWEPMIKGITDAYERHRAKIEDEVKN